MCSSVPLGHKLNAVVIAALCACGLYAFLCYREAQLAAAASLSFDPVVAQQLDSGITRAAHPAVVLGQSILSDSVVANLVSQAHFAASSTAHAIGEFRTRVELTEPASGRLLVRYIDPDPVRAAATANAVAEALARGASSASSDFSPGENTQAGLVARTTGSVPAAESSLASALGELRAQLSSADQRVDSDSSLLSDDDRQRYLESQVRFAQKKIYALRTNSAPSGSASGRLGVIQHALALFWPSADTLETAEPELSYERAQLARVIGVIEQQKRAIQRAAAAAPPSPVSRAALSPLHLESMAGPPAPVTWWPSGLVGCVCGLLYLGIAFAHYHSFHKANDLLDSSEESSSSVYRLFDADAHVSVRSHEVLRDSSPVAAPFHNPVCLAFDPGSVSAPVPDKPPILEGIRSSMSDAIHDNTLEPEMILSQAGLVHATADAGAVALQRASEEPDRAFHEESVERADQWEDAIRRSLSQTVFARMLNPQILVEDVAPTDVPVRDLGA